MNLYDIDAEIRNCLSKMVIDEETGEVIDGFDPAEFEALTATREAKLEAIGVYIKELEAEIDALKNEKAVISTKITRKTNKHDGLKTYLSEYLQANKCKGFETAKVTMSFRRSEVVDVDETKVPKKFYKKKIDLVLDKAGIKSLLKAGGKIKGCKLIEKQNLQIK